jgi:hypothetical protein
MGVSVVMTDWSSRPHQPMQPDPEQEQQILEVRSSHRR